MRIYPASHYTMGGLWVDYELMTTVPGLYCAGEANFSDHGANRLGASALMQGLPTATSCCRTRSATTSPRCSASRSPAPIHEVQGGRVGGRATVQGATSTSSGTRSPDWFHRELGKIIWDYCGMERNEQGLEKALSECPRCTSEFQKDLRVTG
jgi:succinate dehydrogenase / fumarate reductase flavoprotein subunit